MRDLDDHHAQIRPVLESFGRSVQARVPSIAWHVEGAPTRHYALSLLLVFVDRRRPEDELAVIAVACTRQPDLRWTIDATGKSGTLIAEETGLTEADHIRLANDPHAASGLVEAFVRRTDGLVVELLTEGVG